MTATAEHQSRAIEAAAPRPDETIPGILRRRAAEDGTKPYITFPDEDGYEMSYGDALEGTEAVMRALLASGLGEGSRVAVYLPNCPGYVWAWFGTLAAGAADVSVNCEAQGESLAYSLNKARVDAVITDPGGLAGLSTAAALDAAPRVFVLDHGAEDRHLVRALDWGRWDGLDAAPAAASSDITEPPLVDPLGLGSIRFTSGSTGHPKGTMLSQAHMLSSAYMFCHMTGFGEDDLLYSCYPVHHAYSSITGVLPTLAGGGSMILMRKFSASRYWKHVREYGATVAQTLSVTANMLMAQPPSPSDREHNCRVVYMPAMPEFEERFGVTATSLFDMTELTVLSHYPAGVPRKEGSCGVLSGLFDVAIVDEFDNPVPAGEEGEIAARPRIPNIMTLGYFDDPDLTVGRERNLWFHTHDRGMVDGDGHLYFRGRAGDRIRRRGVNVSPGEVEAAAARHTAVEDVAAIGVPADIGEDEIKVAVALTADGKVAESELLGYLREGLPPALVPRYVEIRETFPRTGTGKILKRGLREEGAKGLTPTTWDAETGDYVEIED